MQNQIAPLRALLAFFAALVALTQIVPTTVANVPSASDGRHLQGNVGDHCYVKGVAPLCRASCSSCTLGDTCVDSNYNYGAKCWSGNKVLCCKSSSRRLLTPVHNKTTSGTDLKTETDTKTTLDSHTSPVPVEQTEEKEERTQETDHAESLRQLQQPSDGCYVIGAAPFCAGKCTDCTQNGDECRNQDYRGGAQCALGHKVLCCRSVSG
uniref:Uncharacterized protein n=1 Tax=Chromera velia CCMP2878 TaxID=1169474 RepID=A0A0G4FTM6_9ALVE|eukprot:Cvel_18711.t1-p1 / transcript=Cvel_18711.t1 / gene=Cvel_18711 / organism=Chromera_velia_CCMP2878 / gene_product=hypothetical protein / transcript_product=hypothetical protein / location=Cvel_scaffold1568:18487-19288(-) / protein_length=208 / sequence_SO=supercontig / SO=protein_coding / is_pseudo=false